MYSDVVVVVLPSSQGINERATLANLMGRSQVTSVHCLVHKTEQSFDAFLVVVIMCTPLQELQTEINKASLGDLHR